MAVTTADIGGIEKLAGILGSAGERLALRCEPSRVGRLLIGAVGGELIAPDDGRVSVTIEIEDERDPFAITGFEPVGRGAWRRGHVVVCTNVCSSGFDLRLTLDGDHPSFTFRRRPPIAAKAAGIFASRARQLTLLTLLAYPAMWWAARNGRAPIHVSAFEASGHTMLVAGPAGVGKSTVLQQEVASGARPVSDNLCVTDGVRVWPVSEPMRIEGADGKRAPHGRAEKPFDSRPGEVVPRVIVALRRGPAGVRRLDPPAAARAIVAGTYMAGELRRFWSFAATLAAATEVGPSHPPVIAVAEALSRALPCVEVTREATDDPPVSMLVMRPGLEREGVA